MQRVRRRIRHERGRIAPKVTHDRVELDPVTCSRKAS
jgi:hypothetical protein